MTSLPTVAARKQDGLTPFSPALPRPIPPENYATSPNLEGVATWLTSDFFPMTFWKLVRSAPLSVSLGLPDGEAPS
jgi:hypothetical protein